MIFNWKAFVTVLIVCVVLIGGVGIVILCVAAFEKHWAAGIASLVGAVLFAATIAGTLAGL